jgi:hypothetical protein
MVAEHRVPVAVEPFDAERIREHHEVEDRVGSRARHRLAHAIEVAIAGRPPQLGLLVAHVLPEIVPGTGHVVDALADVLEQAAPDVDVGGLLLGRETVVGALAGLAIQELH